MVLWMVLWMVMCVCLVWCCEGRWMKKRKWEVNVRLQAAAKASKHVHVQSRAREGALGTRAGVSGVWKEGGRKV
jgi:hypothetical protein